MWHKDIEETPKPQPLSSMCHRKQFLLPDGYRLTSTAAGADGAVASSTSDQEQVQVTTKQEAGLI